VGKESGGGECAQNSRGELLNRVGANASCVCSGGRLPEYQTDPGMRGLGLRIRIMWSKQSSKMDWEVNHAG